MSESKLSQTVPAAEETPTKLPKAVRSIAEATESKPSGVALTSKSDPPASTSDEQPENSVPVTPAKRDIPSTPSKDAQTPSSQPPPKQTHTRKPSAPSAIQPASKGHATVQASDAKAAPVTPSKPEAKKDETGKRKHPGKLDITAAVTQRGDELPTSAGIVKETPVEAGTPVKLPGVASRTPSIASKPESPGLPSPVVKTAPRTIRVVPTPKAETPPPHATATPGLPTPGHAMKLPSRQPSVASINPPGTPSSEQVSMSDNISMTDTSISRANSPPPGATSSSSGKVGSAPIRAKTKSQLKKERQERAKAIEEEKTKTEEETKPVIEEPTAQEAIISRKKKTKKEKEPKAKPVKSKEVVETTAETTPTASRSVSPGKKTAVEKPPQKQDEEQPKTPVHGPVPPMLSPHEPSPPPTPTLTAASLLAELKVQDPDIVKCLDSFFRTPTSAQFKPSQPITAKDLQNPSFWKPDFKLSLTKDEVDALLKGTLPAIHYGGDEGRLWDRGMVTPSGAHLKALSEELEARFLYLEKAIRDMPEELRFHASKPQNELKFPSVDLEALRRSLENLGARGPSVMEQMVQDGSTMKKGAFLVDEASRYINEFVMPPATPPPSSGGATAAAGGARAGGGQQAQSGGGGVAATGGFEQQVQASVETLERQWLEAKRITDEQEGRLKKVMKKNRRLLGLS